jgi:hypothetical protein
MIGTRTLDAIDAEVKAARMATAAASRAWLDARINREPPEHIAARLQALQDAGRAEAECERRATAERDAKRIGRTRLEVHRAMDRRRGVQ